MFKKMFKKKVKYGTYIDRSIVEYNSRIFEYSAIGNNPYKCGEDGPTLYQFYLNKDGLKYQILDTLENIEIEVIKHFYKDEVRDIKIKQILDAND